MAYSGQFLLENLLPGLRGNTIGSSLTIDLSGSTLTLPSSQSQTTPVIAGGLTASGSGANDFSGSTGTFKTSTGAVTIGPGAISVSGTVTMTDAFNIVVGSTTGTKIGTATTQKIGFFNVAPVVQPSSTGAVATTAAGSTTTVFVNTTFTGGSGATAYTVADIIGALKSLGLLAA